VADYVFVKRPGQTEQKCTLWMFIIFKR